MKFLPIVVHILFLPNEGHLYFFRNCWAKKDYSTLEIFILKYLKISAKKLYFIKFTSLFFWWNSFLNILTILLYCCFQAMAIFSSIFLMSSTDTKDLTYNEETRLAAMYVWASVFVMTLYLTLFGPVTLRLEVKREVLRLVVLLESTVEPPTLMV